MNKKTKLFFRLSVFVNLYVICVFVFPGLGSFGTGRVVQCGAEKRASLGSRSDILGLNRHYFFAIRNAKGVIEYSIRIYTSKVILWPPLRANEGALIYDSERHEAIINLDGTPIRIAVPQPVGSKKSSATGNDRKDNGIR